MKTRTPLTGPSLVHIARWKILVIISGMLLLSTGCEDCTGGSDAGPDAALPDDHDAGPGQMDGDGGPERTDGGEVGLCDENTDGVGDACAAIEGQPECGFILCCVEAAMCEPGQITFCFDPGPNACGVCGDLDESVGRVGDSCGEFGCGTVVCGDDGTATVCSGDHPRNACDGCADLGTEELPGASCSECMTGELTCARNQDEYVCWNGRAPNNVCGGCERCVLGTALMDERFGGGYIKSGTRAVIEDIGNDRIQLVFDPLIEGPGASALPNAIVSLSRDGTASNAVALTPNFASDAFGELADPVRQYVVEGNITEFTHVLIFESTLIGDIISSGAITFTDASTMTPPDAGPGDDDAGQSTMPADAGILDAGAP